MTHEPLRTAFSGDFTVLRERFQAAARRAGAMLQEYVHPLHGPLGETLATDVALLGKPNAQKLLIVISGTHGAEAQFGAACQVNWLTADLAARLPDDTAVLMIHQINPWGAAWVRRVNEDNVDLNRNFIDWSKPSPDNKAYAELHSAYACPEWDGPLRDEAELLLASAKQRLGGQAGLASVVWAGQYAFPDGLFYGGDVPVWSNRTLKNVLAHFAGHASHVVAFDLHTGAGPYGYPALLSIAPADHPGLAWGRTEFGPGLSVLLTGQGAQSDTGVAATATGYVSAALLDALPNAVVLPLVIECGTLDAETVLDAIRADHWLHLFGKLETPLKQHIKTDIRRAFNPDDEDWRDSVLRRSLRYFDQALAALNAPAPASRVNCQPITRPQPAEAARAMSPVAEEGPPAVLVEDLRKCFGPLSVLNGLGVTARSGEVVSIIGSSGSGKSTFLRCINLLEQPDSGHIAIAGEAIRMKVLRNGQSAPADMRQVERLRTHVGMVFQSFNLWPHLTVMENIIEAPVHVLKEPRRDAVEHAHGLLKKVGLSEKHGHYPSQLSGGQQQRAAIARTLAMRPKVMLFDEPTSALDPELVGEVLRVIRQLVEEGNTMILVTHEMQFAREVSSKVLFLHQGKVEEEGAPAALFANPRSDRLRQFLTRTF